MKNKTPSCLVSSILVLWILSSINAFAVSEPGDYAKSCNKTKQYALNGLADAQFWYGVAIANGSCPPHIKNPSLAVQWFSKAAMQGQADAMFALGVSYLKGNGVVRDRNRGYELIFSAAEKGSREAQNLIELCKAQPSLGACN
jgi:TPR repeat protein